MLWIALMACAEPTKSEVEMTGLILSGLDATTGAADVDLIVRDGNTDDYSQTTTDDDGRFTVKVPASSVMHLEIDGSGYVPTAFSATSGAANFEVPVGALWLRSELEIETLKDTFDNCPSVDLPGGVVEGEVHFNAVHDTSESHLIAEEATVIVYEADGSTHTVCYLDTDGESLAEGDEVGATGRFAAFGIPAGPITVGFTSYLGEQSQESFGYVLLPDNGVGPFYPALIQFP